MACSSARSLSLPLRYGQYLRGDLNTELRLDHDDVNQFKIKKNENDYKIDDELAQRAARSIAPSVYSDCSANSSSSA